MSQGRDYLHGFPLDGETFAKNPPLSKPGPKFEVRKVLLSPINKYKSRRAPMHEFDNPLMSRSGLPEGGFLKKRRIKARL
ncbi:MAG: hypothetical protein ACU83N_08090 [Gammaproteobacteria bacterium]